MNSFKRWISRACIVALGAVVVLASMPTDADARRGFGPIRVVSGGRKLRLEQGCPEFRDERIGRFRHVVVNGTPPSGFNQPRRP